MCRMKEIIGLSESGFVKAIFEDGVEVLVRQTNMACLPLELVIHTKRFTPEELRVLPREELIRLDALRYPRR